MLEEKLLEILREKGPMTRKELMEITGIPLTTLYVKLVKLSLKGKVRRKTVKSSHRGRPKTYWESVQ
ncbi:MAG: winged helix-turn-helix transcriptional regulator [Candidatus Baldrarchaeia archaeon]|nr:helix-turn-helix domain-containing protein [Candidatus Baldrarchaeota archaeon]